MEEVKLKYKIGETIALQVQKKLIDAQLLIFDLQGFSARLHIRNLSNNAELSKKLFDIIEIGEIITSEIIDFNLEKKYVELSLKPFRNELEGSLSFTKCKKIIEARKEMRINQHKDMLEENRNSLDRIQGDLAKVDLTFLYELIQNAIDHPNPKFDNVVSINFEVHNDYLLLKHDGNIFTENNFRSLTGILLGEEETAEDRIGYKGIGFKSIFRYTQEVYIRSGNFSFSFSKERSGAKMPWEVIPVFENEIDKIEEIKNFDFFNTPVAFAFKFTNGELKKQAIEYLEKLIDIPETLLFLNKLSLIEVKVGDKIKKINRRVLDFEKYEKISLQSNGETSKEWIVCKESEVINDTEILKELKDENNPSIPLKFRNFKRPQVQIAYPLNDSNSLINLYAYLPLSEAKYGVPFIINADFIPNLDRTNLIQLHYNDSLGKLSANAHLKLVNVLINEGYIENAIASLDFPKSIEENKFWLVHIEKLKLIKDEIILDGKTLKDAIIDTSGLFSIIDDEIKKQDEKLINKSIISILSDENKRLLIENFGFEEFTVENACSLLNITEVQEKLFGSYVHIVKFLKSVNKLANAREWQRKFSSEVLLFTKPKDSTKKVPLREVTFGLKSNYRPIVSYNLDEQLILDLDDKILGENVKALLSDYSLIEVNIVSLLDSICRKQSDFKKYIENNQEDKENIKNYIINVWSFLYECRELKNIDQNYLYVNSRFNNYPIITQDVEFLSIFECSLSEKGEISDEIVEIYNWVHLNEINVISSKQIAENLSIKISDFNKFLITISPNIKNTDEKLLQNFIKEVSKNNYQKIKDLDIVMQYKLLNSIAKICNRNKENPINIDLKNYPLITQSGMSRPLHETYLAFPLSLNKEETLAQKLFKGIEEVDFISEEYFNKSSLSAEELLQILGQHGLSNGIKLTPAKILRDKNQYINLSVIDNEYMQFNTNTPNFQTTASFSIINDLTSLSGKNENLIVFWNEVLKTENWDLLKSLRIGNVDVDNPFIYLLKKPNLSLFPMQDGSTVSYLQVLNGSLEELVFNSKYKLAFGYKTDSNLIKKIPFSSQLNLDQTIDVFQNLEKLDFEKTKRFMNLVITKSWDSTEFENLKDYIRIPDKNKSIIDSKELVYLDSSFQNGIIDTSRLDFPNNKIAFEFDYKESYKAFIDRIGMKSFSFNDVSVKRVVLSRTNATLFTCDILIEVLKGLSEPKINEETFVYFSEMLLKPCEEIEIHIEEVQEISEVVQAFIDEKEKIIYFKDEWNLAEILSIKLELSSSPARKLRNRLIEFSRTTQNKDEIESTEEISESAVLKDGENKIEPRIELKNPFEKLGLTEEEVQEMERLLKRKLSDEEMENQSIVALYKGLNYYEELGFDLSYTRSNIDEMLRIKYLKNIKANDCVFNSIVRSGANGILYLKYNAWIDFQKENFELAILKDYKENSFEIVKNIQSLSELTEKDTWIIQLNSNEKTTDIQALFNGDLVKDNSKKFTELTILIRLPGNKDFSKIFDIISVPNNYATDQNDIQ